MKLWLQYALAGSAGILLGFVVQQDGAVYPYIFALAEFGLRFGRFILFPLFFFTLAVSVCQLRREKFLAHVLLKIVLFSICAAGIQILISTGLSLILPIDRIPIISETSGWQSPYVFRNTAATAPFSEILRRLLPVNAFEMFMHPGDFMLPALVFSFFLGTQIFHDREEAEPVYNLFDSFSRMIYRMNSLFVRVFAYLLLPVSCVMAVHIKGIGDVSTYFGLFRILLLSAGLLLFGVYPLCYYLITRKKAYRDMRVFFSALLASLFSGDNFINSQILLKTLKENGGVKRKMAGLSVPVLTMFSRAGTAMVTSVCLLTILKSYSSLELTAFQVFWVMGVSLLVSFTLFSQSYMGVYTALIISCSLYGRGLAEGYVLLLPILPILIIFAGLLDTANIAFISLALGKDSEFRYPRDPQDYI